MYLMSNIHVIACSSNPTPSASKITWSWRLCVGLREAMTGTDWLAEMRCVRRMLKIGVCSGGYARWMSVVIGSRMRPGITQMVMGNWESGRWKRCCLWGSAYLIICRAWERCTGRCRHSRACATIGRAWKVWKKRDGVNEVNWRQPKVTDTLPHFLFMIMEISPRSSSSFSSWPFSPSPSHEQHPLPSELL